jgi:beta-galactosidase
VLVQSDKESGEIRLKALSENIKGTEVIIKTIK